MTQDVSAKLRERAVQLLESGQVEAVIGWAKGRFDNVRAPLVARDVQQAGRLVFDEYCIQALGTYLFEHAPQGKVALYARGCESRAVNRLIADNQLSREQVHILGIPCSGMLDPRTGDKLKKCRECQHLNPVVYDEIFGEPVEEPAPYRFAEVDALEAMDARARRAFFDDAYSKCIRCYACRNACPCCTCKGCFVDSERVGWEGRAFCVDEMRYYGMVRAFHTGDRCIECGECERVCPMGLPLMTLMHKQVRDIDALFGPYEGGGLSPEGPDPLRTYRSDDIEEFM